MKTIIITGPSSSGKTFLTNKLSKYLKNTIVIKTDSYYRSCILIKILSIFLHDIYDRKISIKINEINKTLRSIYLKKDIINFYEYDYKNKKSTKYQAKINYDKEDQYLILEGIFAHRIDLNNNNTINIICQEQKEVCFKRRLIRDISTRGRDRMEVHKRFSSSWDLFYKHINKFIETNKVIFLKTNEKKSIDLLIKIITQKNNQDK
tara:strand:- start:638 stop:1255 length:618 start_codon:yes stop_codon:yes gene_type:complete